MSGFYIGVDGKARKVKGGYIGIDGKARKLKKGYIGVDGVARLCWAAFDGDPVFANNTWEQIAAACQAGTIPDTWAVGDQKTMTIGGTDYAIDIIGKDHDDYADGSGKAPLTFQFHETYATSYQMHNDTTNACSWEGCYLRTSRMHAILALMPQAVQAAVKEVSKTTSAGGKSSSIITTADKLFALSEVEVFGTATNSFAGEGTQYEYYQTRDKIKRDPSNGNARYWWERSPANHTEQFCRVGTSGTATTGSPVGGNYVAPAFCF